MILIYKHIQHRKMHQNVLFYDKLVRFEFLTHNIPKNQVDIFFSQNIQPSRIFYASPTMISALRNEILKSNKMGSRKRGMGLRKKDFENSIEKKYTNILKCLPDNVIKKVLEIIQILEGRQNILLNPFSVFFLKARKQNTGTALLKTKNY